MTQSAKIQLVIGAVLVVLLPLVCYLDDRPKEKTAGQIAWEERKEKEEQEEMERKQKKQEEERKEAKRDQIDEMGRRIRSIAMAYVWDSYETKFGDQGEVVLKREVEGGSEEARFNITSVNFTTKSGKTYATCNGCIRYQETSKDENYNDIVTESMLSQAAISSESQSLVELLQQYKQLIEESMLGK